jgi:hypothetical protein
MIGFRIEQVSACGVPRFRAKKNQQDEACATGGLRDAIQEDGVPGRRYSLIAAMFGAQLLGRS